MFYKSAETRTVSIFNFNNLNDSLQKYFDNKRKFKRATKEQSNETTENLFVFTANSFGLRLETYSTKL